MCVQTASLETSVRQRRQHLQVGTSHAYTAMLHHACTAVLGSCLAHLSCHRLSFRRQLLLLPGAGSELKRQRADVDHSQDVNDNDDDEELLALFSSQAHPALPL